MSLSFWSAMAIDVPVQVMSLCSLRCFTRWSWPVCLIPGALWVLADAPLLYGRRFDLGISLLGTVIYLLLYYCDRGDWGKKLWGKIKSASLTVVNAARFQRQVKEARS